MTLSPVSQQPISTGDAVGFWEAKIQAPIFHRRILAFPGIGHRQLMRMPLQDLHASLLGGQEQGGAHLAHAASHLHYLLPVLKGNGRAVTLFLGALSQGFIKGKGTARWDHRPVDGLTGQA